jgi:transcriptional regulator with XRE-family HTH domain
MAVPTLGQRLEAAMKRKSMSAADVARAARTTEATVSNWIKDNVQTQHVKAIHLFSIADAVGMSARELLTGGTDFRVAEDAAQYSSQPVQREVYKIAVQLVSEALEEKKRKLPPPKLAETVDIAYDMLTEGLPQAKVLRFVLAAVA